MCSESGSWLRLIKKKKKKHGLISAQYVSGSFNEL